MTIVNRISAQHHISTWGNVPPGREGHGHG